MMRVAHPAARRGHGVGDNYSSIMSSAITVNWEADD
jgi:hypothetical protein